MLFQQPEERVGKAEVARSEFLRILRTVDAGKIENKVTVGAKLIQLCRRVVDIICVDLLHGKRGAGAVLPVAQILQVFDKIAADKSGSACDKDLHTSFLHTILLTTPT